MTEDFNSLIEETPAPNDFATVSDDPTAGKALPLKTSLLAIASANDNPVDTAAALQTENMAIVAQRIEQNQEFSERLRIAQKRQERTLKTLNRLRDPEQVISKQSREAIDSAYNNALAQRIEDDASTAAEEEGIRRIHDQLSTDPVEARLTYNLLARGGATQRWYDEAAKQMILAQKAESFEAEAGEESWGGTVTNFLTSMIPTNSNFARSGLVPNSRTSLLEFFTSGSGLSTQGQDLYAQYTPQQLAEAVKDGGELDKLWRSNSTTLGAYDPGLAASLTRSLSYQTQSDREWANIWGVADAGTVALPFVGIVPWRTMSSIPGALTRLGSRSSGVTATVDAFKTVVNEGAERAAAKGIPEGEIVSHLEPTALNPAASTPNSVPLGVDVQTGLRVAEEFIETQVPEIMRTTRFTNAEEAQAALTAAIKAEETKIGRSIKDVEAYWQNVRTGDRTPFRPAAELPEEGNAILRFEYTFGKKSGGGFATAKSAAAEARKRGLADTEIVYDEVAKEFKTVDPDFSLTAYHGTADVFDKFDVSLGGKSTNAASARSAIFATNNPDVAWSYAVSAARDASINLPEMKAAAAAVRDAASKVTSFVRGKGLNPASLETEVLAGLKTTDEVQEYRKLLADHGSAQIDYQAIRNATSASQQQIRPLKIRMRNPYVHDYDNALTNGYDENTYSTIIEKAKADGHDGVIFRNTYDAMGPHPAIGDTMIDDATLAAYNKHDVYAVFNPDDILSPWDAVKIDRDVSGQYFAKNTVDVTEEGFRTTPLNTPNNRAFAALRSDARRMDRDSQAEAVASGLSQGRLQKALNDHIRNALKGLSKTDKLALDEILRAGQNQRKWLADDEFSTLYERLNGTVPSHRVTQAYHAYRLFNDVEYVLHNDIRYSQLVSRGAEEVTFSNEIVNFEGAAYVKPDASVPTKRTYNVSDGVHYTKDNPLTAEGYTRLKGQGYLLVETPEAVRLADGTVTSSFLVKRGNLQRRALDKTQLAYREGGHGLYVGKYFAKQTKKGKQPDTGVAYLMEPATLRTGNNSNRLRNWASVMNRALDEVEAGNVDPSFYDDLFAAEELRFKVGDSQPFPTGEEFLRAIDEGHIQKDSRIEIVYDRELPSDYATARDDIDRFVDETETGANGYYRSTGRTYTGHKGEVGLRDESGEFAETVDPWDTMNSAIAHISRLSSFSNYKSNALERFANTYGEFLSLRQLENATPMDMIGAEVRDGIPSALERRIKAEQAGLSRIMNFETGWEKKVRQAHRDLATWVLGNAENGWRETAHDFVYWLEQNNPVQFLRGVAFDAKLGMFNFAQFVLQTSTTFAALFLDPRNGMKAMQTTMPLFAYSFAKSSPAVLDVLAKRSWKVSGFETEKAFKDFVRFVDKSGWLNVGNTHLLINQYGPTRVFGAGGRFDAVREAGRSIFYKAEVFNRSVAARLAYERLLSEGVPLGSATFRDRFVGLADDLTMNMTSESSAAFQHGLASIPTQFWSYNIRMMDAMFGNGFTKEQRARLILSQFALLGVGGVPLVDAAFDYWQRTERTENFDIDSWLGTINRGLIDRAIYELAGADVRFGERIGTGEFSTNLAKDLFGMSEYGEKSPVDALGGATYSISKQIGKTLYDVGSYALAETGGDQGYVMTRDNVLKLAMNVSTFSNISKAMLAYNYGMYRSAKGTVLADDVPQSSAFWIAMGIRPQEVEDASMMKAYLDNKKEVIAEASKQLRDWRQEAFNNPDAYEPNKQKANLFVKLLPAEIRRDVLEQTNSLTDQSFYDSVERKYRKEIAEEGTVE